MLGRGSVDVKASRSGDTLRTEVRSHGLHADLVTGAVLPDGASVQKVTVNGKSSAYRIVPTARGNEVQVTTGVRSADVRITLR